MVIRKEFVRHIKCSFKNGIGFAVNYNFFAFLDEVKVREYVLVIGAQASLKGNYSR